MKKEQNTTLNVLKAIACIHVVLIHCIFPEPFGTGVKSAGRFAVPLFFCISGYFFTSLRDPDDAAMARKLRHSLTMIFWAEAFHVIFSILLFGLWSAASRNELYVSYFKTGWIEKYFLLGQSPVFAHLWFLYALAVIYALMLVFIRSRKRIHAAYFTIPVSLIGIMLMQEFRGLDVIRNSILIPGSQTQMQPSSFFFFRALPFFLTGMLIREMKEKGHFQPSPGKQKALIVLAILFQACAVAEGYIFPVAQFYVGSMLAMVCMMLYGIMKPDLRIGPMDFIGGKLSMYVYIIHYAVMRVWDRVLTLLHVSGTPGARWTRPVMTLLLSLGIAYLVNLTVESIRQKRQARQD